MIPAAENHDLLQIFTLLFASVLCICPALLAPNSPGKVVHSYLPPAPHCMLYQSQAKPSVTITNITLHYAGCKQVLLPSVDFSARQISSSNSSRRITCLLPPINHPLTHLCLCIPLPPPFKIRLVNFSLFKNLSAQHTYSAPANASPSPHHQILARHPNRQHPPRASGPIPRPQHGRLLRPCRTPPPAPTSFAPHAHGYTALNNASTSGLLQLGSSSCCSRQFSLIIGPNPEHPPPAMQRRPSSASSVILRTAVSRRASR